MAFFNEAIDLSPAEQLLIQLLLDCRYHILTTHNKNEAAGLNIWFTGGWVRDKLLGRQSLDVDIVLSIMTGLQFADILKDHFRHHRLRYTAEAERLGIPVTFTAPRSVESKPENCKNLQTATNTIFGLSVDYAHLRKEVYDDESRNPSIEFGTVAEDALRRDATINAIYFDINTRRIMDYTKRGLQDLDNGILRTPLDPYQTLMDDPLRILRMIRFASRFGFTVDEEVMRAMRNPDVTGSFKKKIQRERVGIEVEKIVKGRDASRALELIFNTNLYTTVFLGRSDNLQRILLNVLPPKQPDDNDIWPCSWPRAFRFISALSNNGAGSNIGRELIQGSQQDLVWMMAAWAPLAPLRYGDIDSVVRGATDALKTSSKLSRLLRDSLVDMEDILALVNRVAVESETPRSVIGMAIRSWGEIWRLQVLYALLATAVCPENDDGIGPFSEQVERYSKFLHLVVHFQLQDAYLVKPILNGSEVKNIFKINKTGPFMKDIIDGLLIWGFDHEDSSKDDAKNWLVAQREQFKLS